MCFLSWFESSIQNIICMIFTYHLVFVELESQKLNDLVFLRNIHTMKMVWNIWASNFYSFHKTGPFGIVEIANWKRWEIGASQSITTDLVKLEKWNKDWTLLTYLAGNYTNTISLIFVVGHFKSFIRLNRIVKTCNPLEWFIKR